MIKLKKKEIFIAAASLLVGGVTTVAFIIYLLTASFSGTRTSSSITVINVGPFGLATNLLTKILPTQTTSTTDGFTTMVVILPSLIINSIYLGGMIAGIIFAGRWLWRRRMIPVRKQTMDEDK